MVVDLKPNEMILKAGDTLYLHNGSKIKGKLILTNQTLYFKPANDKDCSFDMGIVHSNIREVMVFKSGLLGSNGLNIITIDGLENRFTIKERDNWCTMINRFC